MCMCVLLQCSGTPLLWRENKTKIREASLFSEVDSNVYYWDFRFHCICI